jgi:hypothetical protein
MYAVQVKKTYGWRYLAHGGGLHGSPSMAAPYRTRGDAERDARVLSRIGESTRVVDMAGKQRAKGGEQS